MLNITLKIKSSCFLTISNWVPGFIDEQYGKGLRSFTIHTKGFSLCEELLTTTGLKNRKRKKRRNTKRGQLRSAFPKMLAAAFLLGVLPYFDTCETCRFY